MTKKKIFVIIAAYNEEKTIAKVIAGLRKQGYGNIIVVNDCSKDATSVMARKAKALVLDHPINRGQGAALQTGMEYALAHGADYIVHFDGDDQQRPEEVKDLLKKIVSGKYDIAIGSRFLGKKSDSLPWFRRFALKGGVFILRFFYGLAVTDAHNGFRAMTARTARTLRITQDRMAHASEIIELIGKQNLRWVEVPVHVDYSDYSLEKGHSGVFGWIKILVRMVYEKLL